MTEFLSTQVVSSANQFGLEFLSQIGNSSNVMFSPLSLITALYIVYLGTEKNSESAKELSKILDFNKLNLTDYNEPHEGLSTIYEYLRTSKSNSNRNKQSMQFKAANLLLSNKQTTGPLKEDFQEMLDRYYKIKLAQFNEVDPDEVIEAGDDIFPTDKSRLAEFDVNDKRDIAYVVNEWVSRETKGRIKNLLNGESLPELQDLTTILINAIYLKAEWNFFDTHNTKEGQFYNRGHRWDPKIVPFMRNRYVHVSYYHTYTRKGILGPVIFQALELPFLGEGDQAISVVFLLPDEIDHLAELERELTYARLLEIYKSMEISPIEVILPKFKLEEAYDATEILDKMGVKTMFTEEAKLNEMFESTIRPVGISKVAHKAVVEFNEKGLEAAAGTAVIAGARSAGFKKPRIDFKADHPFVFVVRHIKTNAPLFIGRVVKL